MGEHGQTLGCPETCAAPSPGGRRAGRKGTNRSETIFLLLLPVRVTASRSPALGTWPGAAETSAYGGRCVPPASHTRGPLGRGCCLRGGSAPAPHAAVHSCKRPHAPCLPSSSSSAVMDLERSVSVVLGALLGGGGAERKRDGILHFLSRNLRGVAKCRCHFFSTAWISSYSREEESHCCRILLRLRVEANFFMVSAARSRARARRRRCAQVTTAPQHERVRGLAPGPLMPPQLRQTPRSSQPLANEILGGRQPARGARRAARMAAPLHARHGRRAGEGPRPALRPWLLAGAPSRHATAHPTLAAGFRLYPGPGEAPGARAALRRGESRCQAEEARGSCGKARTAWELCPGAGLARGAP